MVVLVARKTQEIDRQTVLGLLHEQMHDNSRWDVLKINKFAPCVPNGNAWRLHKRTCHHGERGSRTITQNYDNHANHKQSFLKAVPKCWACLETRHRWKWLCCETFKSCPLSHLVTPGRSLHEPGVIVSLSSEAKKLPDLVVLLLCTEFRLLFFFFEVAANCCFLLF